MAAQGLQRQRHGVSKNLLEIVGGLVVGAALVLLALNLTKRQRPSSSRPNATGAGASTRPEERTQ
jgi:hypothetical protein